MYRHLTRAILPLLILTANAFGESAPILIDGKFGDWTGVPSFEDERGDGGPSGIDFGALSVSNDAHHLFLRISLGKELTLQENNRITLYIDNDDDRATGEVAGSIGAEFTWTFGERTGRMGGRSIGWAATGIVASPSYSSEQFEIAIPRDASTSRGALFPEPTIRIALRDASAGGDWAAGTGSAVGYTFDETPVPEPELIPLEKEHEEQIRLMTYNVLFDGPWDLERTGAHARLLVETAPDIIAFQEIYQHDGVETREWVRSLLPGDWFLSWGGARNELKTLSRWPILQVWDTGAGRAHATLLDLPDRFTHDLLLVNVHFSCCRNEEGRQAQADALMAFVRDTRTKGGEIDVDYGTPIVIVGDTNMYGRSQQVRTLLTGDILDNENHGPDFVPDWDGTALDELLSRQPSVRHTYTWYDQASSFSPSHIDRIAVTGSALKVAKSFILHTPLLPDEIIASTVLKRSDSETASDHLPHVVDFAPFGPNESGPPLPPRLGLRAEPNPFNPTTTLRYTLPESGFVSIDVYNAAGEHVENLVSAEKSGGDDFVEWSPHDDLSSGIYFARIQADGVTHSTKVTLVR